MSTVLDAPKVASPGPWFSSLPRWTTACDLLAMLAIGVALAVIVGGGFRIRVGEVRLSVTSPLGPLLIAFLLLGTRHALHRHPNIVERYGPRWAALVRTAAWRATWPPFVASRLGLLIVGALAVYTVGYPRGEPRSRTSDNELLNLPMRWDAGWYYRIASVGYHWDPLETGQQNIAFFPAYPLTMRVVARLFGGSDMAYVFAGIAVSHVAFAWSLLLLYQLARATIDDEDAARGAVLLIACYPFSIYYGAIYTESLFLLGSVGAFLEFRRGRWTAASAWGILAGLTRPNGLLLAVPLAIMAIQSRWWRDHGSAWRRWAGPAAAVVAPLTGIAMFSIYIAALTGDPLAWSAQQAAWGRTFTGAGPVLTSAQAVADHGLVTFLATRPYDVINGAAVVAVACAIVPIGRRLGLAYAVFIVVNLLPPLAMGGTMSMGRFTSTMFPVFLWLAAASPKGTVGIAVAFAVLQGFFGVLFYTWRPLVLSFPRRLAQPLLVTGFFTLLACVNSYPLVLAPDRTIGQHGDAFFSVWRLAWVAHQLRADPGRLFDANIFYPEAATLAYSDAMLVPALAVAPLHWLGVSPLLVYNLTLLAAFVASGVAAYALVRHLTGSTAAALLGGVVFAFAPHRMEHFDHLELQFAFWIPLAALAWHRAADRDMPADHLKVGALTAAQILSSIYHGIFLATWLGFMTIVWHVRAPRRAVRAVALSLALPLAVLAIYSVPYLESRKAVGERRRSEIAGYSARPLDFLSAPASNQLYGWTSEWGANERHLFPGAVALVLAVVGLWRTPDPRLRVHGLGLLLSLVLALGFNAGLYTLLYDWVLPYRGLRVPARAGILILLGIAVLAGAGLARALGHARSRRVAALIVTLVLGASMAEYRSSPGLIPVDQRVSAWYGWLREVPDAVVFEWPVTVPWRLYTMHDVRYMYRSTQHWRPLLNGYSGNYPKSYTELLYEMRPFPYSSALRYLRRRGATVLVVHERQASQPTYDEVLARLHRDPYIELIANSRDAGARVAFFRLLSTPRAWASQRSPE